MKRAAIYARISITSEESVSVERQIEAAEQYAASRGWKIVAQHVDDGVSASKNKPEDRKGWRALLDSPTGYDVVIIWKVDRLARRVLDFLHADEALQDRGAGLVAVEDPIDMTTAQGRAFAQMLAVFGELEAAAISARVRAARTHLIQNGRVVGGSVPYGWMSVANPDGPGMVLTQDPERIDAVRGMVRQVQRGGSIYSVTQWLDREGIATPTGKSGWPYSTVERILRHPILAGMIPFNPGNKTKARGSQVLLGEDGLPVVYPDLAILSVAQWRALVKGLDDRHELGSQQAMPRAMKAKTSGALSGLIMCGDPRHDEPVRMHRGTVQGRPGYICPQCHQAISNFEDLVVEEFLRQKGDHVRWTRIEELQEGGAALVPEIERRLTDLTSQLQATDDDAEAVDITEQIASFRALRRQKRAEEPIKTYRYEPAQHYAEDWAAADDDTERRAILGDAIERIVVSRGKPGRRTPAQVLARLSFEWHDHEHLGALAEA